MVIASVLHVLHIIEGHNMEGHGMGWGPDLG